MTNYYKDMIDNVKKTYEIPKGSLLEEFIVTFEYLLDYAAQTEIEDSQYIHCLMQGGRLNGKTYLSRLQQENQELKEAIEDYERIFDIWSKRTLINKFNKEYSKKVVKEEREKGHKIVSALPDAEYVYKKYYELQERIDKAIDKLGRYATKLRNNGGAFAFCVDLLDILKGDSNE